jgi:hypothetical protein
MEKRAHLKKGFPMFFVIPCQPFCQRAYTRCHPNRSTKKKGAMMQKAMLVMVTQDDKLVRRRELPCVRHSRSLHKEQIVRGAVLMSMEKKSDEETKKKQRKRIGRKGCLCRPDRSLKI